MNPNKLIEIEVPEVIEEKLQKENIKAKAYLHSSRERMYEIGEQIGLEGKILDYFSFAISEIEVELEVDKETGAATIIKVNGRELLK